MHSVSPTGWYMLLLSGLYIEVVGGPVGGSSPTLTCSAVRHCWSSAVCLILCKNACEKEKNMNEKEPRNSLENKWLLFFFFKILLIKTEQESRTNGEWSEGNCSSFPLFLITVVLHATPLQACMALIGITAICVERKIKDNKGSGDDRSDMWKETKTQRRFSAEACCYAKQWLLLWVLFPLCFDICSLVCESLSVHQDMSQSAAPPLWHLQAPLHQRWIENVTFSLWMKLQ